MLTPLAGGRTLTPLGRSSGPILLASGSVLQANAHVATVALGALCELLGVDLTQYLNRRLRLIDGAGKVATGYPLAAGTGESLGGEELGAWQNGHNPGAYYPYNILTTSGTNITSAVATGGAGGRAGNAVALVLGALYKAGIVLTPVSGANPSLSLVTNYPPGFNQDFASFALPSGSTTRYFAHKDSLGVQFMLFQGANINGSWSATNTLARVSATGPTGVTIASTPGGATQSWASIDSGFQPNGNLTYEVWTP